MPDRPVAPLQIALLLLLALLAGSAAWLQPPAPVPVPAAGARLLLALLLLGLWLLFCLWSLWPRRRSAASAGDGALLVVHASQTGRAEQLAERSAEALRAAGRAVRLLPLAELDRAALVRAGEALFLVSTTGEGDAPDSALPFLQEVMPGAPTLTSLRYGLLALGDRGYAQFCGFGRQLDGWLRGQGARPLFGRIEVDDADAAALRDWQQQLGRLGAAPLPDAHWPAPDFGRWRLVERRLLNPGSLGGPAYHLAFEPLDGRPDWQAGDLAELRLPGDPQTAARRDYSIASLPADGRLELLVRLLHDASGRPGLGSGWLCLQLPLQAELALRLRQNRRFHLPAEDRPLILIGNGTGLAGLRALLKARVACGQTRNWLLFGERHAEHDHFHRPELDAWQAAGLLAHADYAWSRDPRAPAYVQQRLREQGARLRVWVAEGAAIYVCGSAQGMAPAVDGVLRESLGETVFGQLLAQGRYRRDVY